MDKLTVAERSAQMRLVRGKDTLPELTVRRLAHGMGYRYRLHVARLPGKPDLVFPALRKIIFVHGCFWHGHQCRAGRNRPASHTTYWTPKLDRNIARDKRHRASLRRLGWRVMVIWECQLKTVETLRRRLARFLANA
jgi:DNA mismatch endonuclease, patch repair protein